MLDRDTIAGLWSLGGEFRNVAVDQVMADFRSLGDFFFDWLVEESGFMAELAPREFCFLNTGLPSAGQPASSTCYTVFPRIAKAYDDFMYVLDACLKSRHSSDRLLGTVYSLFPGIRADLEARYPGIGRDFPDDSSRRQLMVFVCGQCNLHCPYCFSHDLARLEISEHDLRRIFAWAAREGCDVVTPCGGEPLLYSNIGLFLNLVGEYGMTTYLASNFTSDFSRVEGFDAERVKRVYVHFTRESLANPAMRPVIERNIEFCKESRIDMTARVNLVSPDFEDAAGWIDLTWRKGIKRLNIALTIPSRLKANRFVCPEDFNGYVETICRLVDRAGEAGIALGIAKPLPLCIFPEETAMKLLRSDSNVALCGIHQSGYMNNLSLSTDLAFSPCLGLTDVRRDFDMSLTWDDLSGLFAPGVERLLSREVKSDCSRCFLKARGLCQGFCLSYKYRPDEDFRF